MAGNQSKAHVVEEELARGVWQWAKDIGYTRGEAARIVITPVGNRGRFSVRLESVNVVDSSRPWVTARVEEIWPTSQQQTLLALLMTMSARLSSEIEAGDVILAALGNTQA